MENGIRIRNIIFEQLMDHYACNRKHWEMLCSSDKPLVPFIGAGISAWCYPTWNELLTGIVKDKFSEECAKIVKRALECKGQPNIKSDKDQTFYWMEEIAECIFDHDEESYKKNEEKFKLVDEIGKSSGLPEKNTESGQSDPDIKKQADVQEQTSVQEFMQGEEEPNMILRQLRDNVGKESVKVKLEAVNALYEKFDSTLLKEKRMPEYQKFFHRIFSDILITTNYDRALECCYPSLFSYSYMDLNDSYEKGKESSRVRQSKRENTGENSWLFRVVQEKLYRAKSRMNGQDDRRERLSVPNNPMLLKVHGSIEHVEDIALTASKYEAVYNKEVKKLLKLVFEESTLIFLGSGLRSDRYLDELKKKCKKQSQNASQIRHFAFLCISEEDDTEEDEIKSDDKKRMEDEKKKREKKREEENNRVAELAAYGIYPIFYSPNDLKELVPDAEERRKIFHEYFLGLFMENLSRRKMYYPQPLELLWDKERFEDKALKEYLADIKRNMLMKRSPQIVHPTEARQIWNVLNFSSDECPIIAITGSTGSGRSALCTCIPELSRDYKDTMQFFYISFTHCIKWEEFCMQLFEKMNIVKNEIPKEENWRAAAQLVTERCSGYWRSVLILDQLDELRQNKNPRLWDTVKKMLWYWKEQQTRVIFTCMEYPEWISCYTWHIGELEREEAKMVFFSACTSKRYRNISYLEQRAVDELFSGQSFQPASAHLLGKYANSKNDLNSLLEEWKFCQRPGDNEEQILARMLWNYLLAEHAHEQKEEEKEKEEQIKIQENILWVWGILDTYPGVFPSVFFTSVLEDEQFTNKYKIDRKLTEKTLRYMKNAGLCEESFDEQKSSLLKNFVVCVKKYFFEITDTCGSGKAGTGVTKYPVGKGKFSGLYGDFEKELEKSEEKYYGLECFRGYTMDNYSGELKKYVLKEIGRSVNDYDEQVKRYVYKKYNKQELAGKQEQETLLDELEKESLKIKIQQLLDCLGRQVESNEGRRKRKKLNVVLHYEIKLIVRFLFHCLSELKTGKDETDGIADIKKRQEKIAQIGYRFSHYFHYIPNNAFPLAMQLLEIMEKNNNTKKYELANMCRVMGDIQRLLGKKTESDHYYKQAVDLCDNQMLELFSKDNSSGRYQAELEECKRVRAGALLISNDYYTLYRKPAKDHPGKIYKSIGDKWGCAYYNQRMGEMLFDLNSEPKKSDSALETEKELILQRQRETIDLIIAHYNKAAKLYMEARSTTGTAYILKCMGDLIEKFRKIYDGCYTLKEAGNKKDDAFYYKIVKEKGSSKSKWAEHTALCYRQAFIYYYGHINWRGFANVIQAMGTVYRISCEDEANSMYMNNVSKLYGLAEECYRWLGDVRGLSDTLDFFGYGYRDCGFSDDRNRYMALSKWMESKEMWKDQGNDWKAGNISREIDNLRSKLKEDTEDANAQTGEK